MILRQVLNRDSSRSERLTQQCWCLACGLALGVILSSCSIPAPAPTPKPSPVKSAMARKLLSLPKVATDTNYVPTKLDVTIPWKVNVEAWRFCWALESSTNLVDWKEEPVPVVPWFGTFCLSGDPTVVATNPFCFFRLHGVEILK